MADIRTHGLSEDPVPILYFPVSQLPERTMTIVAAIDGTVPEARNAIADVVRTLDPQQPVFAVRMMDAWVARSVAQPSFSLVLLSIFSILALALAAIGVYGVMAFNVSGRMRELGIRLALGATPSSLLRFVLRQSLTLTAAGVVLGLVCGTGATIALERVFFDANASDPLVLGLVSLIVGTVAALASYIPARRAMRVDPVEALRFD